MRGDHELIDNDEFDVGAFRLKFVDEATRVMPAVLDRFAESASVPALPEAAARDLLHHPTELRRVLQDLLALVRASYIEIRTNGEPHENTDVRLEHDNSYGAPWKIREELYPRVRMARAPVLIENVATDPEYTDALAVEKGIRSVIVLPLMYELEVLGVLYAHQTATSAKERDGKPELAAPFTRNVGALCCGVGTLIVQTLLLERRRSQALSIGLYEDVLPPTLVAGVASGKVSVMFGFKCGQIHRAFLGESKLASRAMRSASKDALALSPIERVALAGQLLDSVVDENLDGLDQLIDAARDKER